MGGRMGGRGDCRIGESCCRRREHYGQGVSRFDQRGKAAWSCDFRASLSSQSWRPVACDVDPRIYYLATLRTPTALLYTRADMLALLLSATAIGEPCLPKLSPKVMDDAALSNSSLLDYLMPTGASPTELAKGWMPQRFACSGSNPELTPLCVCR